MKRACWVLAVLVWGAHPEPLAAQGASPASTADADARNAARALATLGRKRFDAGKYEEALTSFVEASKYVTAPTIWLYIARCQDKLGRTFDARESYRRIIQAPLAGDAPDEYRQAQVAASTELIALDARTPGIVIDIHGSASASMAVRVDDKPVPNDVATSAIYLRPGSHRVEVVFRGADPIVREVTVPATPPLVHVDVTAPTASPEITPSIDPSSVESTPPPRPGRSKLGPAISFGVAGLGLAVGGITGGIVLGRAAEIKQACSDNGGLCPRSIRADAEGVKTIGYVSTTAFAVAGAAAVLGTVLLLLPSGDKPSPNVGVVVGPSFVGVQGTFR